MILSNNLFLEAHIYEVDPNTRARITPRIPITLSTLPPLPPLEFTEESYDQETSTENFNAEYEQEDFEYEKVSTEYNDLTTTEETKYYEPTVIWTEETTIKTSEPSPSTTEASSVTSTQYSVRETSTAEEYTSSAVPSTTTTVQEPEGTTEVMHETAYKHTVYQINSEDINLDLIVDNLTEATPVNIDVTSNEESFTTKDGDQYQEESQNVESWTEEELLLPTAASIPTRLTNYKKDIDTSLFGEDTEYTGGALIDQVNEHGQNIMEHIDDEANSGDNHESTTKGFNNNGWAPISYVEIDRTQAGTPVVSIEEVDINESVDYSEPDIIYDETKEGFKDDSNTRNKLFAFPVYASFNLPKSRQQTTTESERQEPTTTFSTTTTEQQPSTTTEATTLFREVSTTTATTTTTTTTPEPETTTRLFRRKWFTTLRPTTEELSTTPELTTEVNKFHSPRSIVLKVKVNKCHTYN